VLNRRDSLKLIMSSALLTTAPTSTRADDGDSADQILIDPRLDIAQSWKTRKFVGTTLYENVTVDGIPAIRGRGDNSASGLIRKLEFDPWKQPNIRWQWRVERLQPSADIRNEDTEDFAAVIFFLFGKPGLLYQGIRSLGYVWTTDSINADSVVRSIRRPKQSRYLVLQSGEENLGQWIDEERNLLNDYRRVYEKDPPVEVSGISLFVDNDQTGEAVESLFGSLYASD